MNLPTCLLTSIVVAIAGSVATDSPGAEVVDAATLRGKVVCGYQGWFRCPGDAANLGWVHWSRNRKRITPESLTFELWPDMSDYGAAERFAAPGFTYPDGRQAELFSSDNAVTVLRHFQWMRDYGIDGAFLQRFLVGLPGGPAAVMYESNQRVLHYAASQPSKRGEFGDFLRHRPHAAGPHFRRPSRRIGKSWSTTGRSPIRVTCTSGGGRSCRSGDSTAAARATKCRPSWPINSSTSSRRPAPTQPIWPVAEAGIGGRIPTPSGRSTIAGSTPILPGIRATTSKTKPAKNMPTPATGPTICASAIARACSGCR